MKINQLIQIHFLHKISNLVADIVYSAHDTQQPAANSSAQTNITCKMQTVNIASPL